MKLTLVVPHPETVVTVPAGGSKPAGGRFTGATTLLRVRGASNYKSEIE